MCELQSDNEFDKHAEAVKKGDFIVGHVPQTNSKVFAFFICRGESINAKLTGKHQRGVGHEIPFTGSEKDTGALPFLLKK